MNFSSIKNVHFNTRVRLTLIRFAWVMVTLLSYYRRHKSQTLFLLIGLVSGVALWSAVQIINAHAKASYAQADQLLGAEARYWIRAKKQSGIELQDYVALRRAGWRQIIPVLEKRLSTEQKQPFTLIATDVLAVSSSIANQPDSNRSNQNMDWRKLVTPPYQVWIPDSLARQLGVEENGAKENSQLVLRDGRTLPPARIQTRANQGQRLFMDIGAASQILQEPLLSYLAVGKLTIQQEQKLRNELPEHLMLLNNYQQIDLGQVTESLHIHLTAMGLLSFAVGMFIVFSVVRYTLQIRNTTLVTLREMGVSLNMLACAIFTEAFLFSLIGTALGLVIGYQLSYLLLPSMASTLQNLYGAALDHTLLLNPTTLFISWLLVLAGLSLALVWPLWLQAKVSLTQSRQSQSHWIRDQKTRKNMAKAGLVLLVITGLGYGWMNSLIQSFTVLAGFLFSVIFILPWTLELCLNALRYIHAQKERESKTQEFSNKRTKWTWMLPWAISDGFAQLGSLRVALMAFLLALTANIGVETLVNSFRTSLDSWLDNRISADVYVQANSLNLQAFLKNKPDNIRTYHLRNGVEIRWNQHPVRIRGIDPEALDTKQLPMASTMADSQTFFGETGFEILANEQVKHLAHKKLGDQIALNTDQGTKTFTIVGFFHDYGNPYFQFYLPYNQVKALWRDARDQNIALWLNDVSSASITKIENELLQWGARPGDWIFNHDVHEVSVKIFDRTFAITASMNGLTFLVAGIALLSTLMALHQKRLPEYAHWFSLGVCWRNWLFISGLPLFVFLVITWLLAIPLGILLAYILINDINVVSFGWTMDMYWSNKPIVYLGVMSLVVAMVAFLISAVQVKLSLPLHIKQLGNDL